MATGIQKFGTRPSKIGKRRQARIAKLQARNADGDDAHSNIAFATFLMVAFYCTGIIMYTYNIERFSVIESLYFTTVTMFTVGYGDYAPTKEQDRFQCRLYTIFFVIFGVTIILCFLGELMAYAGRKREEMIMNMRKALISKQCGAQKGVAKIHPESSFSSASFSAGPPKQGALINNGAGAGAGAGGSASGGRGGVMGGIAALYDFLMTPFKIFPVLGVATELAVYVVGVGLLFAWLERDNGWTLIDGMYFSVITGTTVGYGDIFPTRDISKLISLGYIPFAVVFVGAKLGTIGELIFAGGMGDELQQLMDRDLSLGALLAMDEDGDGKTTEFEFLKFMLVTAGLADDSIMDALHARFTAMDTDGGGSLTREDLIPPDKEGVEPLGANGNGDDVVRNGVLSLHGRLGRLQKRLTSKTKMQTKQVLLKQLHALAKTKKANRKAKHANKITDELIAINKDGRWERVELEDEVEWHGEKQDGRGGWNTKGVKGGGGGGSSGVLSGFGSAPVAENDDSQVRSTRELSLDSVFFTEGDEIAHSGLLRGAVRDIELQNKLSPKGPSPHKGGRRKKMKLNPLMYSGTRSGSAGRSLALHHEDLRIGMRIEVGFKGVWSPGVLGAPSSPTGNIGGGGGGGGSSISRGRRGVEASEELYSVMLDDIGLVEGVPLNQIQRPQGGPDMEPNSPTWSSSANEDIDSQTSTNTSVSSNGSFNPAFFFPGLTGWWWGPRRG